MQKKRTFIIGLIWGLIFFWWLHNFFYLNWYFRFYSPKAWVYLLHEFKYGWRVRAVSDWIFIFTLIFALPLFFWGWYLCLKIKWLALFKWIKKQFLKLTNKKSTVVKKQMKLAAKKSVQKERPPALATPKVTSPEKKMQKMPSSAIKKEEIDLDFSAKEEFLKEENIQTAPPAKEHRAPDPPKGGPSFLFEDDDIPQQNNDVRADTLLSEIKMPERERTQENIPDIIHAHGFKPITAIVHPDISFAAVSSDTLLVAFVDEEPGDWLADEEDFEGEDPLWFSESFHRVSPVFKLLKVAKKIRAQLENQGLSHKVIPYLIEKMGNIINVEDMQETWEELGVIVCRTDVGGDETLPTVEASFPQAKDVAEAADLDIIKEILKKL